jgi:type VII secretion protein EccB
VSAQSLAGTPVGTPIGIPGAPDAPPDPGSLSTRPWTVCLRLSDESQQAPTAVLMVTEPAGAPLDAKQAVLVSGPDNAEYLLWQGHRYRLAGDAVARALGYDGVAPLAVPAGFLNPIQAGRDLAAPSIPGTGSSGPVIDGTPTEVGQVVKAHNAAIGSDALYVVRTDGLARLNQTTEALLLAATSTRTAYPHGDVHVVTVDSGALTGIEVSSTDDLVSGYPSSPPVLANATLNSTASPCVRFAVSATGTAPQASLLTVSAAAIGSQAVSTGAAAGGTTVGEVLIPKGTGVLAKDLPVAGAAAGAEYLVTDLGMKFPLSDQSVADALGYSQTAAVDVPNQLLALLPTGPVLDRTAALTPQPTGK